MIYDVGFVFGSDVMMTVAQGFEAPMKILLPIRGYGFGMLGIGDIIVPGFLVSMCLRCDFVRGLLAESVRKQKQLEAA
jgi:minor histocompatibility antigen H13